MGPKLFKQFGGKILQNTKHYKSDNNDLIFIIFAAYVDFCYTIF